MAHAMLSNTAADMTTLWTPACSMMSRVGSALQAARCWVASPAHMKMPSRLVSLGVATEDTTLQRIGLHVLALRAELLDLRAELLDPAFG